MNQKGSAPIIIIFGIVLILGIAGGAYYLGKSSGNVPVSQIQISPTTQPVKTMISTTPTPIDETANWKTYTNTTLKYQFQYPVDWEIGDTEQGSNSSVIQNIQKKYFLVIDFIPSSKLRLMGRTYCGPNPEDKVRCEEVKINGAAFTIIDWEVGNNNETKALVSIAHSEGQVTLELTPVNSETKAILHKILSTFKFLDQNQTSCEVSDASFCSILASIQTLIVNKDFNSLAAYQDLSDETCNINPDEPSFNVGLCEGATKGEIVQGYNIGYNESEGEIVSKDNLVSTLNNTFTKNIYTYRGSFTQDNKAAVVYLNSDKSTLFVLWLKKIDQSNWRIKLVLLGIASKDYINLDPSIFTYMNL